MDGNGWCSSVFVTFRCFNNKALWKFIVCIKLLVEFTKKTSRWSCVRGDRIVHYSFCLLTRWFAQKAGNPLTFLPGADGPV